jgi:7-cyano-7-deazaguanine synthase
VDYFQSLINNQMKKYLVLFSGGQDSTTCLLWAIAQVGAANVHALGFNYGQRHAQELIQAQEIANKLGVDYKILNVQGLLGGSSLTDHTQSTSDAHRRNADLPSSFTAGRNALFLTVAAAYGYELGIFDIVTGTCQTDFSGYPDCRRRFIDAEVTALTLALDADIRIHTPLMYLTKAETWRLAASLDKALNSSYDFSTFQLVRTMTMTDYHGNTKMNEWGMGDLDNPASKLRAKGYYEALQNQWI